MALQTGERERGRGKWNSQGSGEMRREWEEHQWRRRLTGPYLSPNVAGHPLRPATERRLGTPLPYQLANQTRVHLTPINLLPHHHVVSWSYAVLAPVSKCYPPVWDRLFTRYSPVRR